MHDLPRRAHRWHRLAVCGVHFALAVVHATHALLLIAEIGELMMSHREESGTGETERPVDEDAYSRLLTRSSKTGGSDRPVGTVGNPPNVYKCRRV